MIRTATTALTLGALATFSLGALTACGDDDKPKTGSQEAAQTMGLCGEEVSVYDAVRLLTGAALIAARQTETGGSVYQLFAQVIVGMLVNGIDFVALADLELDFTDGTYTMKTGNDEVGFRLFFTEDWEDHRAGEAIPWNVFAVDSYIRDIDVSVGGSITDPSIDYDFEPGPLAGLVDGDIEISGRDPRDLEISLKLDAGPIGFAMDSVQRDTFEQPLVETLGLVTGKWDYEVHLSSTPAPVMELDERLHHGGYGISFGSSRFNTRFYFGEKKLQETTVTFEQAELLILSDESAGGTGAYWDGDYAGMHETWYEDVGGEKARTLYETGHASTRTENTTTYYCDAGHQDLLGTAHHDADLSGGTFVLASGETIDYALGTVETDDTRPGDDPTD